MDRYEILAEHELRDEWAERCHNAQSRMESDFLQFLRADNERIERTINDHHANDPSRWLRSIDELAASLNHTKDSHVGYWMARGMADAATSYARERGWT